MQLDAIHAFVTVVRAGGFAAAGRRLRVPRSTLSRQVQRLEEELGVRLLDRTTRAVRTTEAGEHLFHRCAHALDLVDAATGGARAAGSRPEGVLRLTAPIDVARDLVAGMLPEFRRRYPEVELVFEITQRRVDLVAEGMDLALRGGERLEDSSLVARRIATHALGLFASPAYLAARGTPATPAELAAHDAIAFDTPSGPLPWRLVGPEGPVELAPRAWLRANAFGLLHQAVLAGLGIGLCEPGQAGRDGLRPVLPGYTTPGGALYAVYPSGRRIPPKVRVFVELLAAHLAGLGLAP